jgi:hypothetical protein
MSFTPGPPYPSEDLPRVLKEIYKFSGGQYESFLIEKLLHGQDPGAPQWGPFVQNLSDLAAIPASGLQDNDCRIVVSQGSVYRWDPLNESTADGFLLIASVTQPLEGRWELIIQSSSEISGNTAILENGKIIANEIPTFSYQQTAPSTAWTVVHNLNRYPDVTVTDENGIKVWTGVNYLDANTIVITGDFPFTGWVYLN